LLREFLRARGYLYKESAKVLTGEIVHFTFNAALLISFTTVGLSLELVIIALCASNCLYVALATIRSRIRATSDIKNMKDAVSEAWLRGGKWSLPGVLATWGQNNAFVYLSGLLLSIEATATLAAIKLLLMPINILASGLNSVYKPMWAQRIDKEFRAVRNSTKKLCICICAIIFAYTSLLLVAWEYILIFIFGGEIQASLSVLFLWSIIFILQAIRSRESNMLQLSEDFRYLTIIGVPSAVLCVVISTICIIKFGINGALYGIIVAEMIMIMLYRKRYTHE
jgi:O-antigen/teichoic acid export membrane protein